MRLKSPCSSTEAYPNAGIWWYVRSAQQQRQTTLKMDHQVGMHSGFSSAEDCLQKFLSSQAACVEARYICPAGTEGGWGPADEGLVEEASAASIAEEASTAAPKQPPAASPELRAPAAATAPSSSSTAAPPAFLEFPARDPEPAARQQQQVCPSPCPATCSQS